MSKTIQQFIRKLNNTELNTGSTNDAYIRVSKEIQNKVEDEFLNDLNSKLVTVLDRKFKKNVDGWVRYQFYPSNNEYRIVNLSSIFKGHNAQPGDYVIIEKVLSGDAFHYEIYMKNYEKVCMKFIKSKDGFEILNKSEAIAKSLINVPLQLYYEGKMIESSIQFFKTIKKRDDSPDPTDYFDILNLPQNFYENLEKDSFVEIIRKNSKYYLTVHNSWEFNQYKN